MWSKQLAVRNNGTYLRTFSSFRLTNLGVLALWAPAAPRPTGAPKAVPPPPPPPARRARPVDDRDEADDDNRNPPRATLDFAVDLWVPCLRRQGCDEQSIQELFLLGQNGYQGAYDANYCIFWKVFKKISDGERMRNSSGFLHNIVKEAREWREW